jgi:hypothetical protein
MSDLQHVHGGAGAGAEIFSQENEYRVMAGHGEWNATLMALAIPSTTAWTCAA